jgi:hypothetical protein
MVTDAFSPRSAVQPFRLVRMRVIRYGPDPLTAIVFDDVIETLLEFQAPFLLRIRSDSLSRRFARLLDVPAGKDEVIPPDARLLLLPRFLITVFGTIDGHWDHQPPKFLSVSARTGLGIRNFNALEPSLIVAPSVEFATTLRKHL